VYQRQAHGKQIQQLRGKSRDNVAGYINSIKGSNAVQSLNRNSLDNSFHHNALRNLNEKSERGSATPSRSSKLVESKQITIPDSSGLPSNNFKIPTIQSGTSAGAQQIFKKSNLRSLASQGNIVGVADSTQPGSTVPHSSTN